MEAQWSPQWSLNGRHWSSKGGTVVVQGRQTCRSNWYTMFAFLTGRPMADHCASILRPRRCVCLHPASFGRPVSDRPPRRPLCDCFEHAQNFTATMASMAMPERPVYHPWTTKATVLPPFCLQRRPGQFCGRTMEAERSQPLCKGGINYLSKISSNIIEIGCKGGPWGYIILIQLNLMWEIFKPRISYHLSNLWTEWYNEMPIVE